MTSSVRFFATRKPEKWRQTRKSTLPCPSNDPLAHEVDADPDLRRVRGTNDSEELLAGPPRDGVLPFASDVTPFDLDASPGIQARGLNHWMEAIKPYKGQRLEVAP